MRIVLAAAIAAAVTFAAAPLVSSSAEARCSSCKHASKTVVKTNYKYRTVNKVRNVTKYRDVTRVRTVNRVRNVTKNRYVNVVNRTVVVTRVQPITRVNVVTRIRPVTRVNTVNRIRHVTVYHHRHQHVSKVSMMGGRTVRSYKTVMLPARTYHSNRVVHVGGGSRSVHCNCR